MRENQHVRFSLYYKRYINILFPNTKVTIFGDGLSPSKVPLDNVLIPKHEILSHDEEEKVLASFRISKQNLPKIRSTDPQVKKLEAKPGDVIMITREDLTGENIYYRIVVK